MVGIYIDLRASRAQTGKGFDAGYLLDPACSHGLVAQG